MRQLVAEEGEGGYGGSDGGGGTGSAGGGVPGHVLRGTAAADSRAATGSAAAGEKGKGVQGWSAWMSRPLRHALHSLSLFFGKRFFGVSIGRSFPFGCAGPTEEHCPLFLGLCVVIS
jgi:hypothetical protein